MAALLLLLAGAFVSGGAGFLAPPPAGGVLTRHTRSPAGAAGAGAPSTAAPPASAAATRRDPAHRSAPVGGNASLWRHPLCTNSTAGMLAANCGHTYVGRPCPRSSEHTGTVFWFHGLGDSGEKWAKVTPQMQMPWARFVFPSAPVRRTRLRLRPTAAWFNLVALDPAEDEDAEGIMEASVYINALVDAEVARGIPPERIALVGFSMGGAAVLSAGLQRPRLQVGGIITIASWLPSCISPAPHAPAGAGPVVLMCHGDQDAVIPVRWGRASAQRLARARGHKFSKVFYIVALLRKYTRTLTFEHVCHWNMCVRPQTTRFRVYAGVEHTATGPVLADVASFLRARIPKAPGAAAGDDANGWEGAEGTETDEQVPIAERIRRRQEGRREQMQVTSTLTRLYSDLDVAGGGGGGGGGGGRGGEEGSGEASVGGVERGG
jgi:phospholipase/carboxylesterase